MNRQKTFSIVILMSLCWFTSRSQSKTFIDSVEHEKFLVLCNANRDQSYITVGQGFGNLEKLIFETRISPSFFVSRHYKNWALLLNPQITLRMKNQPSLPIKSPSYKVNLTYFRYLPGLHKSAFKKMFYENTLGQITIAHHSNGSDGSFYLKDSTGNVIDTNNGDFSTDYISGGLSTFNVAQQVLNRSSFKSGKLLIEYHPLSRQGTEMQKSYGNLRVYNSWSMGGYGNENARSLFNSWLMNSGLSIQAGYIFGQMNRIRTVNALDRFSIDVQYNYYPKFFDEIAIFARYYHGQDYYNIYFTRTIYVLHFGITSNIMNLKQNIKTLKNRSHVGG